MVNEGGVETVARLGIVASVHRPSTPSGAAPTLTSPTRPGPGSARTPSRLAATGVPLALGPLAGHPPRPVGHGPRGRPPLARAGADGPGPPDAFDAATRGGWHAARAEHPVGPLAVGAPAHLALWATTDTLSAVLAGRGRRLPPAAGAGTDLSLP